MIVLPQPYDPSADLGSPATLIDEEGEFDDAKPIEEQLISARTKIRQVHEELRKARSEAKSCKHETEVYKRRLKVRIKEVCMFSF